MDIAIPAGTSEKVSLPPNVSKIVSGLQSLGYTPLSAIADVIDNSIDADAQHINVAIGFDSSMQVRVRISDDGSGMDKGGLANAMTYGAPGSKSAQALGRFGLGLKTASTSMCDLLTVVSSLGEAQIDFATWDIDEVKAKNDWVLTRGTASGRFLDDFHEGMDALFALGTAQNSTRGTVVIWDHTFGIIKGRNRKSPANPQRSLDTVIRNLRTHIATTYQRFIDVDDERARNVIIAINGDEVEPWDPFCTKWVEAEDRGGQKTFRFELSGNTHDMICRNFILPLNNEIEDPGYADSNKVSLEGQGIYLYRNQRLIEGPSWFGIGKKETHINRYRVELSFTGELDDLFALDVTKSDAMLDIDPDLQSLLTEYLSPMRREAENRQRAASAKTTAGKDGSKAKRPSEITIARTLKNLDVATEQIAPDGSVTLVGNAGETPILNVKGEGTGQIVILEEDDEASTFIERHSTVEHGALWQAAWARGHGMSVILNTGHDWFRKAYLPNATNEPLVQAIEYLFFALAQAEYNNSNSEERDSFEQFRIDVSRNLQKLVRELPEPADDLEE